MRQLNSWVLDNFKALFLLLMLGFILVTQLNAQCNELLWADEFNDNYLDQTKWNIEVNGDGGGNSELQYYTDSETNISVSEGTLKITARKENFNFHEYTSGRINTKYKGDWRYGKIEARIKLPEGKGIWPAFWMLPTENIYGNWPNSGEIDIMEMIGGGSNDSIVWGTLHVGPPWVYTNGSYKLDEKFSEDFHVFSIEWDTESITWFMDGIQFSKKTAADVNHWEPFQERFFIILNLAVGGNWPGSPDETTQFPQTLEVDYVRVYGNPMEQGIVAIDSAYPLAKTTYTFSQAPDATYQWFVDVPGASILSGTDSNVVQILWGCQSGPVKLEVTFPNCGTVSYEIPVTFSQPEIQGEKTILMNQENLNFSVPFSQNTVYNWVLPDGVQIVGQTDTSSIWVHWGCIPGELGVSINNECQFITVSSTINFIPPILTGQTTVPAYSEQVSYSVTALPDATYLWQVPEGAFITQGQNTSEIKVNFAEYDGDVKVVFENRCGKDSLSVWIKITDTLMLCDYETTILTFKGWDDGVEPTYMENPFKTSVNNSDHVGMSFKAPSPWSGLYGDLGFNLNLKMHNRFSVLVHGPKAGKFLFKLEDVGSGISPELEDITETAAKEVTAQYTIPNEWQLLEFDFTGAHPTAYDRITLFYDFNSSDTNTFYFDDIQLLPADTVFITQSNIDEIIEGSEDGKRILVNLKYDSFVNDLNNTQWSFSNLPQGVTVSSITRQSNDSVILTLQGNCTGDYDSHILNFTTHIVKTELVHQKYDLEVTKGVKFKAIIENDIQPENSEIIQVWPSYVTDYCQIYSSSEISSVLIYQLNGTCLRQVQSVNSSFVTLNREFMGKGLHYMVIHLKNKKQIVKKFIVE